MSDELVELIDEVRALASRLRHYAFQIRGIIYSSVKWDGRTIGDEWLMIYYATNLEWEAEAISRAIENYAQNLKRIVVRSGGLKEQNKS